MRTNTLGTHFCLTIFGESHGECIGGVVDGCPSGLQIDLDMIDSDLERRKTAQGTVTSQRKESDKVIFLSGLFEGRTLGTPISFIVKNEDAKSSDYDALKNIYRPSHGDFVYQHKYGLRDYRGGGRSSARTLLPCVVAGSIAKQILSASNIKIQSFVTRIGKYESECFNPVEIQTILHEIKNQGDSVGAMIRVEVDNMPVGIGDPIFGKLQASLANAMFSINAVKGFEYGEGFRSASMRGSECNDIIFNDNGIIRTKTNHSGGIQAGISNGEKIYFNVAFKPIPTIMRTQKTVDIWGNNIEYQVNGRHDVCVVPRVIPIVEAMTAITILDSGYSILTRHLKK